MPFVCTAVAAERAEEKKKGMDISIVAVRTDQAPDDSCHTNSRASVGLGGGEGQRAA